MNESKKITPVMGLLIGLCFLMFLIYGMYFNGFGANIENMMGFFGAAESRVAGIMTVQSVGCLVMTVVLGLCGERINKVLGLALGALIMGAGGLLIGTMTLYTPRGSGFTVMLVYSLLGGVGYIIIDLLMNGVISDVFPGHKETLLPFVHAFYGTGAMLGPLFISLTAQPQRPETFARPYLLLGAVIALCGLLTLLVLPRITPRTVYADMSVLRCRVAENPAEIFRDKRAWLLLLVSFLYVSCQNGISSWLPKFFMETRAMPYAAANTMLTLYFLGSLIMRFLSALIFRRFSAANFFALSVGSSAVVFLAILLLPLPDAAVRVLTVCLGLLQGCAVPALVMICCNTFPRRTASASSLFVLGVSLASFVTPKLMSVVIEASGYVWAMLLIIAFVLAAVVILSAMQRRAKAV